MRDLNFWKKISIYSTILCGVILVLLMFFKNYIESILAPVLVVGAIVLLVSFFAELMKLIIKRKSDT